jgi:hypothetical protein
MRDELGRSAQSTGQAGRAHKLVYVLYKQATWGRCFYAEYGLSSIRIAASF